MTIIGIDLGVHKIALACLESTSEGGRLIDATSYEAPYSKPRDIQLHELGMVVHDWVYMHNASSVWIEDVLVGNNHKYSLGLAETKGALLAYLAHGRLSDGIDIRTVNVGAWKKSVVGNGHASKDDVRNYIHVTHPAYAPLCGDDQDRYDAACIALYGRSIDERADELSAGRLVGLDGSAQS